MFKHRATDAELLDDFSLHGSGLEKNLMNLQKINRLIGNHALMVETFEKISKRYPNTNKESMSIADLGCGGGDILRVISSWSERKNLTMQFFGFDANPACIDYAISQSKNFPKIQFASMNIFSQEFQCKKFDIILTNFVCHHFNDAQLINLFIKLKQQARIAVIINDLHRHWVPYYAIKILTRLPGFSFLERNDGPLSVLRAFKASELKSLLKKAHIKNYKLEWHWPFRYLIWLSSSRFQFSKTSD